MGTAYVETEGTTSLENQTDELVLVATPVNSSYKFVNWTVNGEVVSTYAHYYVLLLNQGFVVSIDKYYVFCSDIDHLGMLL